MTLIQRPWERIAKSGRKRLRSNNDFFIVITGSTGKGKTVLSWHIMKKIDKNSTIDNNFIVSPNLEKILEKIRTIPRYGVTVLDEGIKILFKQEWYNEVQKILKKVYDVNRAANKATIINIPSFSDLNSSLRNSKVQMWIHVFKRGKAVVLTPNRGNIFKSDPWDMKKNERLMDKASKGNKNIEETWNSFLHKIKRSRAYAFHFEFPNWPLDVEKYYNENYKDDETMYDDLMLIDDKGRESGLQKDRNTLLKVLTVLGFTSQELAEMVSTLKGSGSVRSAINDVKLSVVVSGVLESYKSIERKSTKTKIKGGH